MPTVVAVVDEGGRVRRGVETVVDARLRTMFDGGWVPDAPPPELLEAEPLESASPVPGRLGLAGIDELIGGGRADLADSDRTEPTASAVRRRPPTVWRVDPGRRGAAAVVLVVAATALLVGWRVLASQPHSRPVAGLPTVSAPASSVRPSISVAARAREVVVDVVGKVKRPGVVTLPSGSRVVDALRAAGGPLPGTNLASVNLARPLVDGEQIAVGVPGASAPVAPPAANATGSGATGALVDLNTATVAQFDALPGVGPVLAQRIVDWRTMHGTFTSVDQLNQVSGIGDAKFADIKPLVTV